jgi:hypothetical protein
MGIICQVSKASRLPAAPVRMYIGVKSASFSAWRKARIFRNQPGVVRIDFRSMRSLSYVTRCKRKSQVAQMMTDLALTPLSVWGKFRGLHACGATFSYSVPLPIPLLNPFLSHAGVKRKDFPEVARLPWAQEVRGSNPRAPTKISSRVSRA